MRTHDQFDATGSVPLDGRLEMHAFEQDKGSVGFCYLGREELTLVLDVVPTNDVTFSDVMRNKLAGTSMTLSESPVCFTSSASVAEVAATLEAFEVSLRATGQKD